MKRTLAWTFEGNCIRCTSHGLNDGGYVQYRQNGYQTLSRLILSKRFQNRLTPGIVCRHTCDNSWCVNPSHIIHGTTQENTADRVERGRTTRQFGSVNPRSKLSESTVLRIRKFSKDGMSQSQIAALFGLHQTNIHYIVTRKTWRHI